MTKIRFLTSLPISLVQGGQEMQAEKLVRDISQQCPDWDIGFLDNCSEEIPADIYHLVGNSEYMNGIVRFLPQQSKFVISAIHGVRVDRLYARIIKHWHAKVSLLIGERTSYRNLCDLFTRADKILALTEPSRDFIASRYNIDSNRIHVVPNGVEPFFCEFSAGSITDILITGSIIKRKSVLEIVRFARSPEGVEYNFHFIGGSLPNEMSYYNQFEQLVSETSNVIYYGSLEQNSVKFQQVLETCGVFLLLSEAETQSLAALEAMAAGKACVFLDRSYAHVAPMHIWPTVSSFKPGVIRQAIEQAIEVRNANDTRKDILTWEQVASRVVGYYKEVL